MGSGDRVPSGRCGTTSRARFGGDGSARPRDAGGARHRGAAPDGGQLRCPAGPVPRGGRIGRDQPHGQQRERQSNADRYLDQSLDGLSGAPVIASGGVRSHEGAWKGDRPLRAEWNVRIGTEASARVPQQDLSGLAPTPGLRHREPTDTTTEFYATASMSGRAATRWTWIARRRTAGTCCLRRVAGRRKLRTSS